MKGSRWWRLGFLVSHFEGKRHPFIKISFAAALALFRFVWYARTVQEMKIDRAFAHCVCVCWMEDCATCVRVIEATLGIEVTCPPTCTGGATRVVWMPPPLCLSLNFHKVHHHQPIITFLKNKLKAYTDKLKETTMEDLDFWKFISPHLILGSTCV